MSEEVHTKPYTLTFEERPGYLYAVVTGEHDSYEISRAFWQEIAEEADRIEAKNVLIDESIVESVSMADVFALATEIPKMGFGSTRIAFFDRYLEQEEVNAFGELVAVNRGLNGKAFNSFQEAEKWLLAI